MFSCFFFPWVLENFDDCSYDMTCYDILRHCIHQHSGRLYVVLLRVVLILASFISVGATTRGWHRREASPWDFSSLKMEIFVNPLFEGLRNKIEHMWPEATLAPLLDRITYFATLGSKNSINNVPWVNDHIKWLAQANALVILELGIGFLVVSFLLYLGSLLVRMLHQCCKDGGIPDINYASYARRLAESTNLPRLVEEINQEERDMTGVKHPSHHRPVFSSLISLRLTQLLHFSSFSTFLG